MSKRQSPCLSCVLFLFALSVLFSGCGSTHLSSTLSIAVDTAALMPGSKTQLHATLTDSTRRTTDVTSLVAWNSSSPAVATVSTTGVLSGTAAGTAVVSATYDKLFASSTVVLGHGVVQSLALSPGAAALTVGGVQQFHVAAVYADGTRSDVSAEAQWSVLPASVATIGSSGQLTAVGIGPFALTATVGANSASLIGLVSPVPAVPVPPAATVSSLRIAPAAATLTAGATQPFTATATLSDGSSADVSADVAWTSSNRAALTIDANGVATAGTTSDAAVTVTATYNGTTATATANVKPAAAAGNAKTLTALYVQPTSSSIAQGSAEQHTALAFYSDGSQRDVTGEVTWSVPAATTAQATTTAQTAGRLHRATRTVSPADGSGTSSDGVIQVNSQGINTALTSGVSEVEATLGTMQSTSVVLVTPATVTGLQIRASRDRFPVGGVQQAHLIGTFSDGSTQDLSLTANWQSSDTSLATIDQTGLATGLAAGDITLSASFGGMTASTVGFQVLPKTLLSLAIDVPYSGVAKGTSEQLSVLGTYSDGTTHDLTALATWSSLNTDVVSVTSSGFLFAQGEGIAQVTATVGGLQAITTISSSIVALSSVELLPGRPRLALGTTLPMVALGHFSSGAVIDISDPTIWTSLDPEVVTVDYYGRLKSGHVGKTRLSTLAYGVTTTSDDVEVTNATLVRLLVQARTTQLAAGTAMQYTAIGVFSDGSFQDVSNDVVWNTTDYTRASVDHVGLVRAMRPATVQVSATMQGVTSSLPLTVTDAVLVSVTISPGNGEVPVGVLRQYSLIAKFSDGTTQDVTNGAIWGAAVPSIASNFVKGEVIGVSPGTGEIHAAYGFFSASTAVNVTDAALTAIAMTPASTTIRLGQQQQMTAIGTFSDGYTQSLYLNATMLSQNPDVVSILNQHFVANATGLGTTQITAAFRGITATTTQFRVTSNVLQSIAFDPSAPTVAAGSTTQFTANGTFADGVVYNLSNEVTWTSSNPALLTIDSSGKATAGTPTVATEVVVTATFGTGTSSFYATVLPPPTGGSGGSGGGAGGGSGSGSGTGSGSSDGGSAAPAPQLLGIVVVPTSAHLAAGTQVQLTVLGDYTDGVRRVVTAATTWSSDMVTTATVNATGLVTAIAPGIAQVAAQVGSFSAASTVNVSSASLVSVTIQTGSSPLVAGLSQPFALIGTFSDGSQQNLSGSATWTSSNTAIATVSSAGVVTGVSAGSVQFSASFLGQTASTATLSVGAAQPVLLQLTPANASFAAGTTQRFHATATYTDGTTQEVTASAIFTSADPTVVQVDSTGTATGIGAGSTQLTAAFSGLSVVTGATVTPAALVSVAVTPTNAQFALGTAQQFHVVGTFTDGSTQDLSTQAVWTSSNAAVLTIDGSGLATSASTGSAQVFATLQGVTGSSGVVQVTPATLVSLSLMPANPSVAAGTDVQVHIVGHFSDGKAQDLTGSATFGSSDPSVLTAGANGDLHGVRPGSSVLTIAANGKTEAVGITVSNAVLVSLAIAPAHPVPFAKGTSEQFTVTGTFSDGTTQDLSSSAVWRSSDASIATIDPAGLSTGTGVGTATISASYGGQTATSGSVQVTPATATTLNLSPAHANVAAGGTQQFRATVTNSDGTNEDVTNRANWSSTDTAVATVSATGLATGNGPGNSTIAAQFNGVSSTANLAISAAPVTAQAIVVAPGGTSIATGATQQMHATETFSNGSTQDVTATVVWTSSNTAAATVDASGVVTAQGPGSTTVSATGNGTTGSTTVTVTAASTPAPTPTPTPTPVTLQSIAVSPNTAALTVGGTQQFHATGTYSDGTTQDLTSTVAWNSSNTTVATVNGAGLASASSAGTALLTAQSSGIAGTTSLTVNAATPTPTPAATLQSIAVTPANSSLPYGGTQQFHATGTYSDGTTQDLTTTVAWDSSVTDVATVDAVGSAQAHGTGTATVTASSNGMSGSAGLIVGDAPLVSIAVTPAQASLAAGTTKQFTAIGQWADGSTLDVTGTATWSSTNNAVATVSSTGVAMAHAQGNATIMAQLGSIGGSATLTATPATVVHLEVSPDSIELAARKVTHVVAIANFSDGTSQDVTADASFSTSNAGVVTAAPNGTLQAVGVGTAAVQITLNGITATLNVTVSPAILTGITLTPSSVTLAAGMSQQFTATAAFSDGSTQEVTSDVVWTSSATAIATVDAGGRLTALQAGQVTLSATAGNGVAGTVVLNLSNAVVTSIAVTPGAASLLAGQSQQFAATATLSDGSQQTVTASAHWSAAGTGMASISNTPGSNGLLSTTGAGSVTVTATMGSVTGRANATVGAAQLLSVSVGPATLSLAAGTSAALTVVGTYTDGSTAPLTGSAAFTVDNAWFATVDAAGMVHAITAGATTVHATVQGMTGSVAVVVTPATLVQLTLTPAVASAPAGLAVQLAAQGTYSDGSTADLTSRVQWTCSNALVGTVSAAGVFHAVQPGAATVTATLQGATATQTVRTTTAVLQGIAVQSASSSVASGLSVQLAAIGTYSDGSQQTLTGSVQWTSQTPTIGLVSSSGVASGLRVGSLTVTASMAGVQGTLTLSVTAPVLQTITLSPANTTVVNILSRAVQYTATGGYSDGSTTNLTTAVHWSIVSGVGLGTLSSSGRFTPLGLGTGVLAATSGAVTGTTAFTVVSVL